MASQTSGFAVLASDWAGFAHSLAAAAPATNSPFRAKPLCGASHALTRPSLAQAQEPRPSDGLFAGLASAPAPDRRLRRLRSLAQEPQPKPCAASSSSSSLVFFSPRKGRVFSGARSRRPRVLVRAASTPEASSGDSSKTPPSDSLPSAPEPSPGDSRESTPDGSSLSGSTPQPASGPRSESPLGGGSSGLPPEPAAGGSGGSSPRDSPPVPEDGEDLAAALGDWREFRARLVRAGDVAVTAERDADASSSLDSRDAAASAASSAEGSFSGSGDVAEAQASVDAKSGAGDDAEQVLDRPMRGVREGGGAVLEGSLKAATWAHSISSPEQGCLVVAHPDAFSVSQQYFNQAVIFLFAHGQDGSAGVILNRPSQYTLSQVAGLDGFLPEFAACPLYIGGDVGPNSVLCIHGVADLGKAGGEALAICSGVFLGGTKGVKEHVRRGKSRAWDYRWFARYAGWGPGQLEREVRAGYWFLAASSPDIVLKHCVALEVPLWQQVMELMGGEYAALSKRTYGDLK